MFLENNDFKALHKFEPSESDWDILEVFVEILQVINNLYYIMHTTDYFP